MGGRRRTAQGFVGAGACGQKRNRSDAAACRTALANLGKMFPLFCYREEATLRQRLALCVGMWPRGEVGAGVLVVSLGYGIGGAIVGAATMSLALNLLLTGVFIWVVKRLIAAQQ